MQTKCGSSSVQKLVTSNKKPISQIAVPLETNHCKIIMYPCEIFLYRKNNHNVMEVQYIKSSILLYFENG